MCSKLGAHKPNVWLVTVPLTLSLSLVLSLAVCPTAPRRINRTQTHTEEVMVSAPSGLATVPNAYASELLDTDTSTHNTKHKLYTAKQCEIA